MWAKSPEESSQITSLAAFFTDLSTRNCGSEVVWILQHHKVKLFWKQLKILIIDHSILWKLFSYRTIILDKFRFWHETKAWMKLQISNFLYLKDASWYFKPLLRHFESENRPSHVWMYFHVSLGFHDPLSKCCLSRMHKAVLAWSLGRSTPGHLTQDRTLLSLPSGP